MLVEGLIEDALALELELLPEELGQLVLKPPIPPPDGYYWITHRDCPVFKNDFTRNLKPLAGTPKPKVPVLSKSRWEPVITRAPYPYSYGLPETFPFLPANKPDLSSPHNPSAYLYDFTCIVMKRRGVLRKDPCNETSSDQKLWFWVPSESGHTIWIDLLTRNFVRISEGKLVKCENTYELTFTFTHDCKTPDYWVSASCR